MCTHQLINDVFSVLTIAVLGDDKCNRLITAVLPIAIYILKSVKGFQNGVNTETKQLPDHEM